MFDKYHYNEIYIELTTNLDVAKIGILLAD